MLVITLRFAQARWTRASKDDATRTSKSDLILDSRSVPRPAQEVPTPLSKWALSLPDNCSQSLPFRYLPRGYPPPYPPPLPFRYLIIIITKPRHPSATTLYPLGYLVTIPLLDNHSHPLPFRDLPQPTTTSHTYTLGCIVMRHPLHTMRHYAALCASVPRWTPARVLGEPGPVNVRHT